MLTHVSAVLRRLRTPPASREDRNIRRLMAHTGLFGVVQGGVITFLPVLLARLGASAATVSLLTSLPALLTMVLALPAGALVARWRHVVWDSARCFYTIRLSYPPIAAAAVLLDPSVAPFLIVGLWGLTAIPSTLGNTVFYDVLAEAVPPRRRAAVNGARWALLGLVSAISVALFGQMLAALPWPRNYLLLFAICFVAGCLSTFVYSRIDIPLREPSPSAPAAGLALRLSDLAQPLRQSGFARFSLVTLVMRWGFFLPAGVFTIFLVRNLGASDAWIGGRTTLENGALTIGYYVWGRLANRLGPWRMLALAMLAVGGACCLTGLATVHTRWLVLVGALVGGFFVSAVDVSLFEWLLAVMPADERPRYVAMNTLLLNLVAFLAPLAGAAIAQRAGIPAVLFVAGGCLFACAGLTLRQQRQYAAGREVAAVPEA
ncbi:MAG: MFS transporter [Anaerolineae bacterium]|nr:MFS transporter [Anaerolineae bacterium]